MGSPFADLGERTVNGQRQPFRLGRMATYVSRPDTLLSGGAPGEGASFGPALTVTMLVAPLPAVTLFGLPSRTVHRTRAMKGWLYYCAVRDGCSRRVIGHAFAGAVHTTLSSTGES